MANNYLEFSEILDDLTPEELAWWKKEQVRGREIFDNEDGKYDDVDIYDMADPPSNDWEFEGDAVWFHTDESGDVDATADVISRFLKACRPDGCFSIAYSETCSKPRIGEFGGGACFITAENTEWINCQSWAADKEKEWSKKDSS